MVVFPTGWGGEFPYGPGRGFGV
ncbi:MAG: hypothetical protein RL153_2036, partial [Verrucomicrobiota bacterium]